MRELDIIKVLAFLLKKWKRICGVALLAMAFGVVIALSLPKQYTSSVLLAPEMTSGGIGLSESLTDMASNFGIDLGKKTNIDAIYPDIYPEIFSSTDFVYKLLDIPVPVGEASQIKKYRTHLITDTKIPFWMYPKLWLINILSKKNKAMQGSSAGKGPRQFSKEEINLIESVANNISCTIDKKTSLITISAKDEDAKVAAVLADTLKNRLQEYITRYKTKKAKLNYEFYKAQYVKAKTEYVKARQRYTSSADADFDVILESVRARQNDLENDMQLKYNAYAEMQRKMIASAIEIQDVTPSFFVLQESVVANRASSMPRSMMVLLWGVLGALAISVWEVFKEIRKGNTL